MKLNDIVFMVEEKGYVEIDYNVFLDAAQTTLGNGPSLLNEAFLNLCLVDNGNKPMEHLSLEERAGKFFDKHKIKFIFDNDRRTFMVSRQDPLIVCTLMDLRTSRRNDG